MSVKISKTRTDPNTRFKELKKITQKIEHYQHELDSLCDGIVLDIAEGWSTGDKLLDFVLLACKGNYDQFVISMQYRSLYDLGIRKPKQQIIVIQKSEYYDDYEGVIIIRNIYIANLRDVTVDFDLDNLQIRIPVEPNFFCLREFINKKTGLLFSEHELITGGWLITGPIHNQYCDYSTTEEINEIIYLDCNSVCEIELLPAKDVGNLFINHGINNQSLNQMNQNWIREKSKLISKK